MRRNNLRSYQSIIILKPDLEDAQVDQAIEKIGQLFQKSGGSTLKLEKWGKKRLAYKVKKNKFGIYLNIYHTCANDKVAELEKEYQLYDQIIKYLVIKIEDQDLERILQESEPESEPALATDATDNDEGKKVGDTVDSAKDNDY